MKNEIQKQLHELALKRSIPFCYNDYIECRDGVCPKCGSDDLMRLVPGVGCEYGTEWIIKHILETEIEPIDMDAAFEEHVRQCYPETIDIGWLKGYDLVSAMKELDPVAFRCAQSEWESMEADEGNIVSFDKGGTYYWANELFKL